MPFTSRMMRQGVLSAPPLPSTPIVNNDIDVRLDDRDRVARADWSHLRAYAIASPTSHEIEDAFRYALVVSVCCMIQCRCVALKRLEERLGFTFMLPISLVWYVMICVVVIDY